MKKILTILIVAIVVIGLGYLVFFAPAKPGKYDDFAQCLGEKGAVFYGAFWCPHCSEQKAMFGRSAAKLPYVECSTPDGQGMLPDCTEKGVKVFPTWQFANASTTEGVVSLENLATITSCELPAA